MSAPGALSTRCARSPTRAGRRPSQVALAWLAAQPAVSSVILGARSVEQLLDNMGAADLDLGEDALARLTEASTPRIDDYPYGPCGPRAAPPHHRRRALSPDPAPSQGVVSTRWVGDTSIGGGSSRGCATRREGAENAGVPGTGGARQCRRETMPGQETQDCEGDCLLVPGGRPRLSAVTKGRRPVPRPASPSSSGCWCPHLPRQPRSARGERAASATVRAVRAVRVAHEVVVLDRPSAQQRLEVCRAEELLARRLGGRQGVVGLGEQVLEQCRRRARGRPRPHPRRR